VRYLGDPPGAEELRLLQRPIVVLEGRAIIARPPERLNEELAKG
jgi:arsenate reductase-like glutaredoxin family protein